MSAIYKSTDGTRFKTFKEAEFRSDVLKYSESTYNQYRIMGSKLRNTVRTKDGCDGTTNFQQLKYFDQTGEMKPVECKLYDYYTGDWIDELDEIKTNINEMQVVSKAGAYALGRKTDELVINELDKSTNFAGAGTDGLTKEKVLEAFEMMGEADVPDDGDRYAIVGWKQWSDLLQIDEFTKADYVGEEDLPWKGTQAKKWLGTLWMPHSGLTKTADVRSCYWYHKTAIGHAIGQDIKSDVSWHGDRAAHFVNNMMRQGSTLIDPTGVVSLRCFEGI